MGTVSSSKIIINGEEVEIYGSPGATFTPVVSADGVLSWTNNGDLENPTPVNIKGPQGIQGLQGKQGPAGEDAQLPTGGTTGQVLAKASNANGDVTWQDGGISQTAADGKYLQLTGGTMSGDLTVSKNKNLIFLGKKDSWESSDRKFLIYATNLYKDGPESSVGESSAVGLSIPGIVLNGILYANFNRIQYLGAPTGNYDAANKKYVDDAITAKIGDIASNLDSINGEVV